MISIRRRLTVILSLHLLVAVLAAGLGVWFWARRSIQSQFDSTLIARAELIESTIEEDDGHLEVEFNLTRLPEFRSGGDPVHFQIRSRDGTPLITSEKFAALGLPELSWGSTAVPAFSSVAARDGRAYRGVETQFDAVDDLQGDFKGLRLFVLRDQRTLDESLLQLGAIVGGATLAAVACLLPLVRRALKQGLRPLETFAERTGAIDLQKLPHRESLEGAPAELRPMVEKLNELLERVHESLLRERRFTRDVAHELRTPVAELKSLAELACRWSDQATPEAFADVGEIAAEMEGLVASLTLLNKLDAGSMVKEVHPLHPADIVHQIAARLQERVGEKRLTLALPDAGSEVTWQTDAALWKIAASNLMENAVSYSPPGSRIEVTLEEDAFRVANPAPGLTAEDVSRMSQAFWRKDPARSDQSHSGLGLSLVESIARVLSLRFTLRLREDGCLEAELGRGGSESGPAAP